MEKNKKRTLNELRQVKTYGYTPPSPSKEKDKKDSKKENKIMEKRGHHICKMVNYQVRQKVTQETSRKVGGKFVNTPGSVEVMIYKSKTKIEGGMKDIKLAAQKVYEILKKEGREINLDKRIIKKYNLV